jgi:hypothetical protein
MTQTWQVVAAVDRQIRKIALASNSTVLRHRVWSLSIKGRKNRIFLKKYPKFYSYRIFGRLCLILAFDPRHQILSHEDRSAGHFSYFILY